MVGLDVQCDSILFKRFPWPIISNRKQQNKLLKEYENVINNFLLLT
jgi:hypothetical protein